MSNQTNAKTGQQVPDTATTYERAKPDQESPSKSLKAPPTRPAKAKDQLAPNAEPRSAKKSEN